MKYEKLIVEKREMLLLRQIIARIPNRMDDSYRVSIDRLSRELGEAEIVAQENMPDDVVRFNSIVTILDPRNKLHDFQIVTPERGNIRQNRLSIIAPMGLALFGYAQGDVVNWRFPGGEQAIRIINVSQDDPQLKAVGHERA